MSGTAWPLRQEPHWQMREGVKQRMQESEGPQDPGAGGALVEGVKAELGLRSSKHLFRCHFDSLWVFKNIPYAVALFSPHKGLTRNTIGHYLISSS